MGTESTRPMVRTQFHLDLSDAFPGEEYWVNAWGQQHPVVPHTAETRAAARAASPLLRSIPEARLTHYTPHPVTLPADRVMRVHVKHTLKTFAGAKAKHGVGNVAIHTPPPPEQLEAMRDAAVQQYQFIDYVATAKALVFHHPDLINADTSVTSDDLQLHE